MTEGLCYMAKSETFSVNQPGLSQMQLEKSHKQ